MMREFCPVRFDIEPLSGEVMAQAKMTWGPNIRRLYPDFYEWGLDVPWLMARAVAKPVVMGIVG